MKLLVFGNSDSKGGLVEGPPWPAQLAARLQAELGTEVHLRHRGLSPLAPDAVERAERMAREEEPDYLVIPLGSFAFAIGFVEPRIERLFGKRAASAYQKAETAFEARTGTTATRRSRLNSLARRTLRRAVGTQPHASVEQVAAVYVEMLRRLSRMEDLQVVAMTYPEFSSRVLRKNRKATEKNDRFEQLVRAAVAEHHYLWADGREAVRVSGLGERVLAEDGSHLSTEGHALFGELLAAVIARDTVGEAVGAR